MGVLFRSLLLSAVSLLLLPLAPSAQGFRTIEPVAGAASGRVALVVGTEYDAENVDLLNPLNDARDVAAALRKLGSRVVVGTDLAHFEMDEAVRSFAREARGAEVALVYFAGHGLREP